jgi:hypothetical protein
MGAARMFAIFTRVGGVAVRRVGVMSGFLVISGFMMLGGFRMMASCVLVML